MTGAHDGPRRPRRCRLDAAIDHSRAAAELVATYDRLSIHRPRASRAGDCVTVLRLVSPLSVGR